MMDDDRSDDVLLDGFDVNILLDEVNVADEEEGVEDVFERSFVDLAYTLMFLECDDVLLEFECLDDLLLLDAVEHDNVSVEFIAGYLLLADSFRCTLLAHLHELYSFVDDLQQEFREHRVFAVFIRRRTVHASMDERFISCHAQQVVHESRVGFEVGEEEGETGLVQTSVRVEQRLSRG